MPGSGSPVGDRRLKTGFSSAIGADLPVENFGERRIDDFKRGRGITRALGATLVVDVKSSGLFATDPAPKASGVVAGYWRTGQSDITRRVSEFQRLTAHLAAAVELWHKRDAQGRGRPLSRIDPGERRELERDD